MEGSFYRCYLFVLFVYITTYLNTWIAVKLRGLHSMTWIYMGIQNYFPPYRLCYAYQFASFYIENGALILLHLNRFTAIWLPIKHIKIWNLRNIAYAGILIYLIGFSICYSDFYIGPLYVEVNGLAVDNPALMPEFWLSAALMGPLGHTFPWIALALDLLTLGKILYLRIMGRQTNGVLVEINLFLICLSTFVVQLTLMLYFDRAFSLWNTPEMSLLMLSVVIDLFTLSEAYIGLALNRTLRQKLFAMLFGKKRNGGKVSETTSAFQRSNKETKQFSQSVVKF
ncbi:unnamed protein product, partial [Mesorhabditis belari]|uniref:Serpentine receptor class gamma n=1 Tax=Mesorhabditis belari TaxID=2138241 RepID=A0AAF3J4C9_9BILA